MLKQDQTVSFISPLQLFHYTMLWWWLLNLSESYYIFRQPLGPSAGVSQIINVSQHFSECQIRGLQMGYDFGCQDDRIMLAVIWLLEKLELD